MLNRRELIAKKKLFIRKLRDKNLTDDERRKISFSLMNITSILTENDNLLNIKLYNYIDKMLFGTLTILNGNHLQDIYDEIPIDYDIKLDDDYLYYLYQLLDNIKGNDNGFSYDEFKYTNPSDEQIVGLSKIFYSDLGNENIKELANKIFSDSSHYGFTDLFSNESRGSLGVTAYDLVYNKPYSSIVRTGNISSFLSFNHEIMHEIDFYASQYQINDNYSYFVEIPTFTIDFLFMDYLEDMGFDKEQVNALRRYKQGIQFTRVNTLFNNCKDKLNYLGIKEVNKSNANILNKIFTEYFIKKLLIEESYIIAYGLYKQIKDDKEKGLNNLYKLIKYQIPNNKLPDFSFIGLPRERILELSKEIINQDIIRKHK